MADQSQADNPQKKSRYGDESTDDLIIAALENVNPLWHRNRWPGGDKDIIFEAYPTHDDVDRILQIQNFFSFASGPSSNYFFGAIENIHNLLHNFSGGANPNYPKVPTDPGSMQIGLEPGDLTKYSAVPWQADFNECSTQNVDITYEKWNVIDPQSVGDPAQDITQMTFWWPSHRPMEVFSANGQVPWAQGIPQTHAGDLKMVTVWKDLGFIMNEGTDDNPNLVQVERNDQNL